MLISVPSDFAACCGRDCYHWPNFTAMYVTAEEKVFTDCFSGEGNAISHVQQPSIHVSVFTVSFEQTDLRPGVFACACCQKHRAGADVGAQVC